MINRTRPPETNKNIFERHPKKTIFISIILFFIVAELFGQIIYYYTHERTFVFNKADFVHFIPYGLVHHKPNTTLRLPGYPSDLETDQYGFVHNGYKKPIGSDQYLIFLVGGSCVEGRGASSNATTIAACLERILNQLAGKNRFRVVNAGMSGHVSYQELSLIEGVIIPKFKPQMVIAFDGYNDGWAVVSFQEWQPNWQPYFDQLTRDVNRNMEPGFGIVIDLIKRHSIIAATFDKIRDKLFHGHDQSNTQKTLPPKERLESGVKDYMVNLQITAERLKLYGIKYQVFFQPFLAKYLKREIQPDEVKFMQNWGRQYENSDIFYHGMENFYNLVTQEAKNLSFFNDFSRLFLDTPEKIYVDNCHFNDIGSNLIAQAMAHQLWPELEKVR